MEQIIELIKQACAYIKKLIVTVIEGCLNFARNVVGWFKSLNLQQGRDVPFIANANQQVFKEMLQKAPVKDVGIFRRNRQTLWGGCTDANPKLLLNDT